MHAPKGQSTDKIIDCRGTWASLQSLHFKLFQIVYKIVFNTHKIKKRRLELEICLSTKEQDLIQTYSSHVKAEQGDAWL